MAASGYTPIQLYYSTTAAAVPIAGNLANGELAINITDGKLYYKNNSGVVTLLAGATAGPAGGSTTQVQYNNAGVLAGSANLIFDGANLGLGVTPSAWATLTGLQVKNAALAGFNNNMYLMTNAYYDGAVRKYIATGFATDFRSTSGEFQWFTSPSGSAGGTVTLTQVLGINASGALGVGSSPSYGTSGQVLTSGGSGAAPTWTTPGGGSAATPTALGTVYGISTANVSPYTTALGYGAGTTNTTGQSSTFVGRFAGYTSNANYNVFVGDASGYSTSSGANNTAVGTLAFYTNTTGYNNTVVGFEAMNRNTTGDTCAAFGHRALYSQTTGFYNVAVGPSALYSLTTGSYNNAFGYLALNSVTTGETNCAFGWASLKVNTANQNSAFGHGTLQASTTGTKMTAVGNNALATNTTGTQNTGLGQEALVLNTTGSYNVAVGQGALRENTTANYNTALGYTALYNNTTGTVNTVVGYNAGSSITTGSKNTLIGAYTGSAGPISATGSNYIVLSDGDANIKIVCNSTDSILNGSSVPSANGTPTTNTISIGTAGWYANMTGENNYWNHNVAGTVYNFRWRGTGVGGIVINSTNVAFNTSSDYRLKNTIAPMIGALAKVALLKPVTYKWNADGSDGEGFIAHELAEVCPLAVTGKKDAVNEDGSIKSQGIDTSFLVATLTAAIQELKAEFDAYKLTHP